MSDLPVCDKVITDSNNASGDDDFRFLTNSTSVITQTNTYHFSFNLWNTNIDRWNTTSIYVQNSNSIQNFWFMMSTSDNLYGINGM